MTLSSSEEMSALLAAAIDRSSPVFRESVATLAEGDVEGHASSVRELGDSIARGLVVSSLGGRASVWDEASAEGVEWRDEYERDEVRVEGLVTGVFRDALEDFRGRIPRLRSTVDELRHRLGTVGRAIAAQASREFLGVLRARHEGIARSLDSSFWVTGADLPTTVDLRRLVGGAIRGEPGDVTDLPEFLDRAALEGAGHLADAHLETVWRNNLQRSYNDGRVDAQDSPEVRTVLPLTMIDEVRDSRTRETHRRFDGYINTPGEIRRRRLVPPNGHRCRATARALTRADCRRRGLLRPDGSVDPDAVIRHNGHREDMLRAGEYPDPGFV